MSDIIGTFRLSRDRLEDLPSDLIVTAWTWTSQTVTTKCTVKDLSQMGDDAFYNISQIAILVEENGFKLWHRSHEELSYNFDSDLHIEVLFRNGFYESVGTFHSLLRWDILERDSDVAAIRIT